MRPDPMDIVVLIIIILLPIIPAYVLFNALKSGATVSGPLGKFRIQLAGAFAGYFALVVLILTLWHPAPSYQVWHVSGKISFEKGNPLQLMAKTHIETEPQVLLTEPDGSFDVMVSTKPGPTGTVEFPKLFFGNPEYEPKTIALDDPNYNGLQRFDRAHRINLNVQLARASPYNVGATAPQQGQGGPQ